jgi:hypothetical protein
MATYLNPPKNIASRHPRPLYAAECKLSNAGIDSLKSEATMRAHQGKFVAYFRVSTD